jgi:hypothetical protein
VSVNLSLFVVLFYLWILFDFYCFIGLGRGGEFLGFSCVCLYFFHTHTAIFCVVLFCSEIS